MMHEQQMALEKIMEYKFASLDLNLYLDTHPCDKEALDMYNACADHLMTAMHEYEEKYGPLMNFGHSKSKYPWQWIENPWPWCYEYKKGEE